MSSRAQAPTLWLPAIPPIVLAFCATVLIGLGAWGRNPFWVESPMTLAEAAALRDLGAVLAAIERGESPSEVYQVRAGLVDERTLDFTPMQAAVHEDRVEVMELLLSRNARATAQDICGWMSLAVARQAEDAMAFLSRVYATELQSCARPAQPPAVR